MCTSCTNVYQLYQMYRITWVGTLAVGSPPINGQCTNSRYSIVALQWRLLSKWLKRILPRNRQLQEKQLCHFKENILTTQWKKKKQKKSLNNEYMFLQFLLYFIRMSYDDGKTSVLHVVYIFFTVRYNITSGCGRHSCFLCQAIFGDRHRTTEQSAVVMYNYFRCRWTSYVCPV